MVDYTSPFCSEPPLLPVECSAPPLLQQVECSGLPLLPVECSAPPFSQEQCLFAPLSGPKIRQRVVSSEEDIEIMSPGMWQYPTNLEHCCIYRVPKSLRDINPEAYTPQSLLIGPLHHSLKSQALTSYLNDTRNTKFMGYLNMEQYKKRYLKAFSQRVNDEKVINEFKRVIKENEEKIRGSYSESTTWIQSQDFVEMILHDSVFILEFVLRVTERSRSKRGDLLMDDSNIVETVYEDLILLENQLPYFILQKLFDPILPKFSKFKTFRDLIILFFRFQGKIKDDTEFKHFTDLFRCVRVETLKLTEEISKSKRYYTVQCMYNVEKLENAGVKFEVIDDDLFSLEVRFEKDCLKLPCFHVHDSVEMRLRNIMALEQCHYPFQAYICDYIIFLDHLIDTHKDVDILVEKGIIKNLMGHKYNSYMVNKLSMGLVDCGFTYYNYAASKANDYCNNPINRARAILKRVYFSNPWTGTVTVAAVFLLLMTLIQTVASVMQK